MDQSNKISVCDKKGTLPGGINTATQTPGLSRLDLTWAWAQKYQDEWGRLRPTDSLWFARNHRSHHSMICTCAVIPFRRLYVRSWIYSFYCVGCDVRRRLEGSAEYLRKIFDSNQLDSVWQQKDHRTRAPFGPNQTRIYLDFIRHRQILIQY